MHNLESTGNCQDREYGFVFRSIITSSRDNRNAGSTGKYWLIKVFGVLRNVRNNVKLQGKVYIDEMYFSKYPQRNERYWKRSPDLPWMGERMTYKLEPGLSRISSPVCLLFPSGEKMEFENGEMACGAMFDKRWKVTEMRASDGVIEVVVEEMGVPSVNPIGEETFF